jgi:hypothetical protein
MKMKMKMKMNMKIHTLTAIMNKKMMKMLKW